MLRRLKQAPQAIEAFLRAVNINHAMPGSWRMLDGLYRMTGQADNAAMAASSCGEVAETAARDRDRDRLFMDGDLDAAEPMMRAYLLSTAISGSHALARPHRDCAKGIRRCGNLVGGRSRTGAGVSCGAPGICRGAARAAQVSARRAANSSGCCEKSRITGLHIRVFMPRLPSDSANMNGPLPCTGNCSGRPRRCRHASIDCPRAKNAGAERGGHRVLPSGGSVPAELRRRVLESRKPQNLSFHGCRSSTRLPSAQAEPAIGLVDRYHLCFALGKALEDRGRLCRVLPLLRARQCAEARRKQVPR